LGYDENGEKVAIKKLKNPQKINEIKYQENEIDILLYLREKNHPNIVKLMDYVKKKFFFLLFINIY
jgi:serine/threonine protein kinase